MGATLLFTAYEAGAGSNPVRRGLKHSQSPPRSPLCRRSKASRRGSALCKPRAALCSPKCEVWGALAAPHVRSMLFPCTSRSPSLRTCHGCCANGGSASGSSSAVRCLLCVRRRDACCWAGAVFPVLPEPRHLGSQVLLPRTAIQLWPSIGSCCFEHSGLAGGGQAVRRGRSRRAHVSGGPTPRAPSRC